MGEILNKKTCYSYYKKGLFGNKLRTWYSIDEYNKSKYNGMVSIRYSGGIGGMFCAYNVTDVDTTINGFISDGADVRLFVINESAPDEKLLIQGELTKNHNGYQLFYSKEKGKMRDCLKNGVTSVGLEASEILRYFLNPNSYSDIMELTDTYQDHVIEFSTYSFNLGDCRYRNTVIWEVRKY